ncbi:AAA family ATPase [Shewanella marina]|uniref:AAA family ATPase n=1 Tax=Shewanella marina TaxID=487319 RepID=UPI00046EA3EA|nr:AAA family ATPase [Shewanella marina]
MRLKQIKLAGFKSFVDVTKIPFNHPLTAIIGPNGCGKSNVIDAVRWVLGESSAKNLRGDSMTDVIFNGSTARRPVSVASVELLFENNAGRISGPYAHYENISVKRQVSRDGDTGFFLNGQKCRRKDVTDLFMGTGLGARSYAIISQGTISRLVESKPQELRTFIEEAAGISRYKERRRDTEIRIRHTRENLERLGDIRHELGTQLDKLSSQAKAAKQFRELKQQERSINAQLAVAKYQQLQQQISELEQQIAKQELARTQEQTLLQKLDKDRLQIELKMADLTSQEQQKVEGYYQTNTDIAKLEQQLTHQQQQDSQTETQLQTIAEQLQQLKQKQADNQQHIEQAERLKSPLTQECEMLALQLEQLHEQVEIQQAKVDELNLAYEQQQEQQSQLKLQFELAKSQQQHNQQNLQQKQEHLQNVTAQMAKLESFDHQQASTQLARIATLQTEVSELVTKIVATEQQQAQCTEQDRVLDDAISEQRQQLAAKKARLELVEQWLLNLQQHGQQESVWQQIEVAQGWETAVDSLLGHLLGQGVTHNIDEYGFTHQARRAFSPILSASVNLEPWCHHVHWLTSEAEAYALLPSLAEHELIVLQNGDIWARGVRIAAASHDTNAAQLVSEQVILTDAIAMLQQQIDDKVEQQLLLSDRLLAQKQQLKKLQFNQQQSQLALTKLQTESEHILARQIEVKAEQQKYSLLQQNLNEQIEQLNTRILTEEQIEQQQDDLQKRANDLSQLSHDRQQQQQNLKQLTQQVTQIEQQQQTLTNQLNQQQTQYLLAQQQLTATTERIAELQQRQQQLQLSSDTSQIQDPAQRQLLLQQQLQLKLDKQQQQQQQLQQTRAELQQWQHALDESTIKQKQLVSVIESLTQAISELKLRCEGVKGQSGSYKQQLLQDNINIATVLAELPEHLDISQSQIQLDKLRLKIGRLGAINLAAIEEFEQQNERKSYLDRQNDDLQQALASLAEAIRKIDRETRSRFRTTFDQINQDLSILFPKVFGGGSAYLALTDDDLLETGVTIMARPPGKKNSTIHLLSGGEKALTALSLVFAIFRLNPAPFCMLDEVDAPLDDANVERFCRLVEEMSKEVQFIYISHNKITMEMADQLTGVTMHEPGVSRIVAVDIDEAVAMADAG